MNSEPRLFRINPPSKESQSITEVDFAQLGFQERRDIQEWVSANPGILEDELLIVGKEFSGFDKTNERLDLLAVDSDGKVVVIELKRDDSGADAHWQAIKYASYLHHASAGDFIRMLSEHEGIPQDTAENKLQQHLGADDLNALNHDQRIILASHRFAPEVTSAAIWLNQKAQGENLITCIKLTPYQDASTKSLYVRANTIIPVPGIDDYVIKVGDESPAGGDGTSLTNPTSLQLVFERNRTNEVTRFLRRVGALAVDGLPAEIKPDRSSRWAGQINQNWRYYHLWYSRLPWTNWGVSFQVNLYRDQEGLGNSWGADVGLKHSEPGIERNLANISVHDD